MVNTAKTFLLLLALQMTACSSMFYYPQKELLNTPDVLQLDYEQVELCEPTQPCLRNWYFPASTPESKGTILFLHGNAENVSTHLASTYWLPAAGYNVLMLEYRGYGASDGEAEITGMHADIIRGFKYLTDKKGAKHVIIYGQSLGGSMAIWARGQLNNVPALQLVVAEGAFYSYPGMVREKMGALSIFKYLFYPFSFCTRDDFSAWRWASRGTAPLILLHGTADTIVNYDNSVQIAKNSNAMLISFPDKGHLEIFKDTTNRQKLLDIFEKYVPH